VVPPKKKIVYWLEKSIPDEYRASVREGILEWNKAFEKIGFRDAIEVRQQEGEEFDPEDVTYSTVRWITSEVPYAIGPSRVNPLTGEIIDADILFDASMLRMYKNEQQLFKNDRGVFTDPASPIQAGRYGWGLPVHPLAGGWDDRDGKAADEDPRAALRARLHAVQQGMCQCAAHKNNELSLAITAMAARVALKPGDKLPDEMIQQAVKETIMHEVGHTLGLRHNFKASTMLKNDQLHDLNVTRKQGLVGSVMDYNPVNLAPKGVKQGDFFTCTIGPYDYWAIEYGYKPASQEELDKVAARCAQAGLAYGTDEDMFASADPHINQWDMGADTMKYAQDRILLAEELMKGLADRVVEKGEGYQRARQAFGIMLSQYGDAAFLVAKHVGGEFIHRDHKGDENARDPFVPVKADEQRKALKFVQEKILTDKPFQFPPELLRKLASDRWMHWGNEMAVMRSVDYPVNERILGIQRVVLRELLDGDTLARLQNTALKADKGENCVTMADVFRALSDSIFADLPNGDKPAAEKSSLIRRNLHREYLKSLSGLVLGPRGGLRPAMDGLPVIMLGGGSAVPPDAKSLARMHLRDTAKRINVALESSPDDVTRAHLEEMREQINKVLGAAVQANAP
jgi:hypothetical protein